jgi:3-methyladenine DNA glycosylase AlkD
MSSGKIPKVSSPNLEEIMSKLETLAQPEWQTKLVHFGSRPGKALGISMPVLRQMARQPKDHALAAGLWATGVHEARILASLLDEPKKVTPEQMDAWTADFDSWDVCDQVCINLYWHTPWAASKALEWSDRPEEFVRRAGFVMMAVLAVHDKKATDESFEPFFVQMLKHADDPRNFVRKAVNWALRQIGKRNESLRMQAIQVAKQIRAMDSSTARWIAADALRELNQPARVRPQRDAKKETA